MIEKRKPGEYVFTTLSGFEAVFKTERDAERLSRALSYATSFTVKSGGVRVSAKKKPK